MYVGLQGHMVATNDHVGYKLLRLLDFVPDRIDVVESLSIY